MFDLTKKILKEAEPGNIIFNGMATDDSRGINMTNSGRLLRFGIRLVYIL